MNAENLMAQQSAEPWPAPIEVVNETGRSPIVLICDHASNYIPAEYQNLGLPADELASCLAWDIGAADVTRAVARILGATAFLASYSRLLIDLNRPLDGPHSIVGCSQATDIPGNRHVTRAERGRRARLVFEPYHQRVAAEIEKRKRSGLACIVVAIHSFAPSYLGQVRPWHAGVLFDKAAQLGMSVLEHLRRDASVQVGANVPYGLSSGDDYSLPTHGDTHGNPAIQLEIRSDQIIDRCGAQDWARRIASALTDELSQTDEVTQRRALRARGC